MCVTPTLIYKKKIKNGNQGFTKLDIQKFWRAGGREFEYTQKKRGEDSTHKKKEPSHKLFEVKT
jgi:hypothetical protein